MKKIVTNSILVISILAMISVSGCLEEFTESAHPWAMSYTAKYENPISFSSVIQIFERENVSYEIVDENTLRISYGKGVNNETIEETTGAIVNGEEGYYHVTISLNDSKYPPVEHKEDLDSRKPLLEDSMEYITVLIYEATGMWPKSKEFYIGRLYC